MKDDNEERIVMPLEARLRSMRRCVGRDCGGGWRLFEASDRVVRLWNDFRREATFGKASAGVTI